MAAPLASADLQSGEQTVDAFTAAYHAVAADWGVRAHGAGPFAAVFGIKGIEAVGGTLHLTTWRLVFTAARANRFTGSFSVALADLSGVENLSRGIKRAVAIGAGERRWQFGMVPVGRFIAAVEAQRAALDDPERQRSARALARAPAPRDPFRLR